MRNQEIEAARTYHEATKHSEWRLRASRHVLDWENQPLPFKIYLSLPPIPLASLRPSLEVPALQALAGPRDPQELDFVGLSRLLHLSAGITRYKHHPGGVVQFRAHPNTGALYHVDLYLATGPLPQLAAGVYHFSPHDFALRRLREGDHRGLLTRASGQEPAIAGAAAIVGSASTYWRNAWKYQARAYRHCFWDAGTLHANLLCAAGAQGLSPKLVLGFADGPVERLLGLDPEREGALTLVALGRAKEPAPPAPEPPPLRLPTEPLSAHEVGYPAILEAQRASSLVSSEEAAAWRGATPVRPTAAPRGPLFALRPPSPGELPDESLESVIRRRGSTRAFDPRASISRGELAALLEISTAALPADFLDPRGATLIDLYLIVHAVDGLAPGAYFYRRQERALELLREGELRELAGRLGLFQQLPADACVNLYCLADLEACLARFGNRGYRAAQLEGGIIGGRAYLAAYALGFGATGLTFLDDEAIDFFSPHAQGKSVMFLVALGRSLRRRRAA